MTTLNDPNPHSKFGHCLYNTTLKKAFEHAYHELVYEMAVNALRLGWLVETFCYRSNKIILKFQQQADLNITLQPTLISAQILILGAKAPPNCEMRPSIICTSSPWASFFYAASLHRVTAAFFAMKYWPRIV